MHKRLTARLYAVRTSVASDKSMKSMCHVFIGLAVPDMPGIFYVHCLSNKAAGACGQQTFQEWL